MDRTVKYSSANRLIQNLRNQVSISRKESESEVIDLFNKLSSWMEASQRKFSSTIDNHALSIDKGLSELNETICSLETQLSVITGERDDLLFIVNNLSGGTTSQQPLPEQEIGDHQILNGDDSDDVEYTDTYKEEEENEDNDEIRGGNQTEEEEAVERSEFESTYSSPDKSSQVEEEGHICQECNLAFSKDEYLGIHMRNFHGNYKEDEINEEAKELICDDCGYATFKRNHFIRHRRWVHDNKKRESANNRDDKPLKCNQCSYSTTHRQAHHLKSHIAAVHMKIKDHRCGECGFASFRKSGLDRHWDAFHNKGDKKFKCQMCHFSSAENITLKKHVERVHELHNTVPMKGEDGYFHDA